MFHVLFSLVLKGKECCKLNEAFEASYVLLFYSSFNFRCFKLADNCNTCKLRLSQAPAM